MIFGVSNYKKNMWKQLTKPEKGVLLALATYANKYGLECYPRYETVMENHTLTRNLFADSIRGLEKKGAIRKMKVGRKNIYDLSMWVINKQ